MAEPDRLWMFTVYDHPREYPNEFVCRRCYPWNGEVVFDAELWARGPTLRAVREKIPAGLFCLAADVRDDPSIVETWF